MSRKASGEVVRCCISGASPLMISQNRLYLIYVFLGWSLYECFFLRLLCAMWLYRAIAWSFLWSYHLTCFSAFCACTFEDASAHQFLLNYLPVPHQLIIIDLPTLFSHLYTQACTHIVLSPSCSWQAAGLHHVKMCVGATDSSPIVTVLYTTTLKLHAWLTDWWVYYFLAINVKKWVGVICVIHPHT